MKLINNTKDTAQLFVLSFFKDQLTLLTGRLVIQTGWNLKEVMSEHQELMEAVLKQCKTNSVTLVEQTLEGNSEGVAELIREIRELNHISFFDEKGESYEVSLL